MKVSIHRLLFLSVLTFSLSGTLSLSAGNTFLAAAQGQVEKISQTPEIAHKSPLEFKQAVAHYIKHTEGHCLHTASRHVDEDISYKKELRYLLKNYGKFSAKALLVRVRSAHQDMVRIEHDSESDVYKRYEQISSALLLTCAQVFFNDARSQLLNALGEIDHLIAYWRYQQHHQLSYFFSKSPVKWVSGKSQDKEIINNLNKLLRIQSELYTLLGSMTGHIHAFSESVVAYDDCYRWIDTLFELLSCVEGSSSYNSYGTKFDDLAAELYLKIKHVGSLRNSLLSSVVSARMPSHLVRNWIAYTTALAAAGYAAYYHGYHPEVIPGAIAAAQLESLKFINLLIDPFKKIYKRAQVALSPTTIENKDKLMANLDKVDDAVSGVELVDLSSDGLAPAVVEDKDGLVLARVVNGSSKDALANVSLDDLFEELRAVGEEITSDIAKELAKSNTSLREDAVTILKDAIEDAKSVNDAAWLFPYKAIDIDSLKNDLELIKTEKDPEALKRVRGFVQELSGQTWRTPQGITLYLELKKGDGLLRTVNDYLDPLKEYTDIIDDKILKLIRLIALLTEALGRKGDALAKRADDKLQDNELTFMFTALIPLITTGVITTKAYQWITKKNYSPLRIALADVNALLIESELRLDDHSYGKLIYLISKLKHRTGLLKDSLSHEFLTDVAKLESKQYSPHIKRGIVENMFNKYAFLGRIVA